MLCGKRETGGGATNPHDINHDSKGLTRGPGEGICCSHPDSDSGCTLRDASPAGRPSLPTIVIPSSSPRLGAAPSRFSPFAYVPSSPAPLDRPAKALSLVRRHPTSCRSALLAGDTPPLPLPPPVCSHPSSTRPALCMQGVHPSRHRISRASRRRYRAKPGPRIANSLGALPPVGLPLSVTVTQSPERVAAEIP